MATYSVAYLRFFKVLLRCFNFSMVSLLSPFSLSFLLRSLMFSDANSSSVTIPLKDSSSSSMTKSLLIDIVKVGLFLQLLLKVMLFFSLNCWTGWDNPGDKGWMFWRFSSTLVSKVNKLSWLRASNGLNNPKSKFSENCKIRKRNVWFFTSNWFINWEVEMARSFSSIVQIDKSRRSSRCIDIVIEFCLQSKKIHSPSQWNWNVLSEQISTNYVTLLQIVRNQCQLACY